jgi:4-alpha-glucanotransferase
MSNLEKKQSRAAGILLHPTALPSRMGVGNLGRPSLQWLDLLQASDVKLWQVLPLGPTSAGDSPYQTLSVFAGNPYLIDWDPLLQAGLAKPTELEGLRLLDPQRVDFGGLYHYFWPSLEKAFDRWESDGATWLPYRSLDEFRARHKFWLDAFCRYRGLKDFFEGKPWYLWPKEFRTAELAANQKLPPLAEKRRRFHEWTQYLFFGQWALLLKQAHDRGIEIVGDMPIFAALDSADAWSFPEIFQFRSDFTPEVLAGCPPDAFSPDGQFWGNPLYDWDYLKKDGYSWWLERLKVAFDCFDHVRIDHFRGLESYWSIPAKTQNPADGEWVKGPDTDFIKAVHARFPGARLIAEDLGLITPEVIALKKAAGVPGMAVLQFAFGGGNDNFYLPHNIEPETVIYTGTHDNDTTVGWYAKASEAEKDHVRRYFRISGTDISWDLIRTAYASVARLAVVPLQDLLSLGSEARFNTPGLPSGNWQWRVSQTQLDHIRKEISPYLRELAELYRR